MHTHEKSVYSLTISQVVLTMLFRDIRLWRFSNGLSSTIKVRLMKALFDGVVLDTKISEACGRSIWQDFRENDVEEVLYFNKNGYFTVTVSVANVAAASKGMRRSLYSTAFAPMTQQEAWEWMKVGHVEVLSDHFDNLIQPKASRMLGKA